MKLVRVRGEKICRVTVPKELESFVEYMFKQGYSESTIAMVVNDLRIVMKHGLTEKELGLMSGKTARRLRYAWRHYKKFQKFLKEV